MPKMLIKEGMRRLGRNHKLALLIIMALLTLPAATTGNTVATTTEYSAKSNLTDDAGITVTTGSYMTEATMLVYDEILRFQRGSAGYTHGLTKELVDAFDYDQFAANVLWMMDELVGLESDWRRNAANADSTAYGYVQFTEPSVLTAVIRYRYHLEKFNSRSILGRRDWQPPGYKNSSNIFGGTKMKYPKWHNTLETKVRDSDVGGSIVAALARGNYYVHSEQMEKLTYDQMLALAFVHLHSKTSKDYNFVMLALGGQTAVTAAIEIYEDNHHTKATDNKTQARIAKFFKLH